MLLYFLSVGGGEMLGILISLSIPLLVVSLSVNGVGVGGQQVVGVVDALHEASQAGHILVTDYSQCCNLSSPLTVTYRDNC